MSAMALTTSPAPAVTPAIMAVGVFVAPTSVATAVAIAPTSVAVLAGTGPAFTLCKFILDIFSCFFTFWNVMVAF